MEKHCRTLGVSSRATISEIKKAYRNKVKIYHPDVSTHPNADKIFIEITDAYEYLLGVKLGKINPNASPRSRQNKYSASTSSADSEEDVDRSEKEKFHRDRGAKTNWTQSAREKIQDDVRDRARQKIEKERREYQNSNVGKFEKSVAQFGKLVSMTLPVWIIVIAVVVGAAQDGVAGSIVGLVVSAPFWIVAWRKRKNHNFVLIWDAARIFFANPGVQKYGTLITAIIMFLTFVLRTEFSFLDLLLAYIVGVICVSGLQYLFKFLLKKHLKSQWSKRFIIVAVVPFIISLFFTINYKFSENENSQSLQFTQFQNTSTLIQLQDNIYSDQVWLRLFFDNEKMTGQTCVSIRTATGLFGLSVVKSYKFSSCGEFWEAFPVFM